MFGRKQVSYNVHGLIHLSNDVKTLGPLDDFSGFKFENYLGFLKKLLKKPNSPLQQVHRRIVEFQNSQISRKCVNRENVLYSRKHSNGPTLNISVEQFKCVYSCGYVFKTDTANCSCILNNNTVLQIINIITKDGIGSVIAKPYRIIGPLFDFPCDSTLLNIYFATYPKSHDPLQEYPISSIARKCLVLPINDTECGIFPLLHSDKED
jgi:hypothetical protein